MAATVVIGGGVAGLAAAWRLARDGAEVILLERDAVLGGLAGSFERDGKIYPLGYHHILSTDAHLIAFLARLDLLDRVEFKPLRMAFCIDGALHTLATPADFLRFPLPWADKLRLGALVTHAMLPGGVGTDDDAGAWVRGIAGAAATEAFFDRLTHIKFGVPTDALSARWLRARLCSRESGCGYGAIPKADWTRELVDALTQRLRDAGGTIRTRCSATGIRVSTGRIQTIETDTGDPIEAEAVLATLAPPLFARLMPDYADTALTGIEYSGVISSVICTRQEVPLPHYWTNFLRPYYRFGGAFRLDLLNDSMLDPDERIVNFCTHVIDRGPDSMLRQEPEQIEAGYLADFQACFGVDLQPEWAHTSRIPYYSPVFLRGYQNPAGRSPQIENLYFAGNFRTFPVLATTGAAMASGWEVAGEMLDDLSRSAAG